jgi:hypothetical protein
MALAITKSRRTQRAGADVNDAMIQFNALCDALRALFVVYDGDAGITYTAAVADFDAAVSKIGNPAGTAISATV